MRDPCCDQLSLVAVQGAEIHRANHSGLTAALVTRWQINRPSIMGFFFLFFKKSNMSSCLKCLLLLLLTVRYVKSGSEHHITTQYDVGAFLRCEPWTETIGNRAEAEPQLKPTTFKDKISSKLYISMCKVF